MEHKLLNAEFGRNLRGWQGIHTFEQHKSVSD
jgi:hypothetical protein